MLERGTVELREKLFGTIEQCRRMKSCASSNNADSRLSGGSWAVEQVLVHARRTLDLALPAEKTSPARSGGRSVCGSTLTTSMKDSMPCRAARSGGN
jgi:hypothetical protein